MLPFFNFYMLGVNTLTGVYQKNAAYNCIPSVPLLIPHCTHK